MQVRSPGFVDLTRTLTITLGSATREHVDLRRLATVGAKVAVAPGAGAGGAGTVDPPAASVTSGAPTDLRVAGAPVSPASGGTASRRPWVIGTAGLAATALAFGIVEHLAWRNKVDAFATMSCDADLSDRGGPTCGQTYQDGTRARNLAFIGYGAAGALAVTSVILYVTRPDSGAATGTRVACALTLSPTPAGVACTARF